MHDLFPVEVIEIQDKVADFLLVLLGIEVHFVSELGSQLADLGKKGIRSFGLLIIYAALFIELQLFTCFLRCFCWDVAVDDVTPIQILQQLLLAFHLMLLDAFL